MPIVPNAAIVPASGVSKPIESKAPAASAARPASQVRNHCSQQQQRYSCPPTRKRGK
jgi:hypothetical protein